MVSHSFHSCRYWLLQNLIIHNRSFSRLMIFVIFWDKAVTDKSPKSKFLYKENFMFRLLSVTTLSHHMTKIDGLSNWHWSSDIFCFMTLINYLFYIFYFLHQINLAKLSSPARYIYCCAVNIKYLSHFSFHPYTIFLATDIVHTEFENRNSRSIRFHFVLLIFVWCVTCRVSWST